MRPIHVAAAALNQIPMAWEHNRSNIEAALAEARERGVAIVCLSELAITGYGCEDMFLSPALCARAARELFAIAPATAGMVVSVGLPVHFRGAVFDCAALLVDGEVCGLVAKRHLAGDGVHYEPRWFTPWR
ncbi:MAG: nitrilase-related carbon-nitrogen hydrolase, partial [Myxococcota bacterium]